MEEFLGIPNGLWGAVLFCLSIFFIVLIIRVVLEAVFPKLRTNLVWRDTILRLMPFVLGVVLAFGMKNFPRPFSGNAVSMVFMYGLVMGGVSGWGYKILKAQIKNKFNVDVDVSNPPPGTGVKVEVTMPKQDKVPQEEKTDEPS